MTKQGRDSKVTPAVSEHTATHTDIIVEKDAADMNFNSTAPDDASAVILDQRIQALIGNQLASFYRELVNQPIPQNFIDLLAKLDRQENGK